MEDNNKRISQDALLFGSAQFVPFQRRLRAGPVSLVLQDGAIRYIRLGNVELVRRIYMALRDQNWNTIPTVYSDWKYNVSSSDFLISFNAQNKLGDIDFVWTGSILGDPSGRVSYSMKGRVQHPFKKRIIGMCALFPIKECAGQSAEVIKSTGGNVSTSFPFYISSYQPLPGFGDIRKLDFQTKEDRVPVSVSFEGDLFEMEDQRSFTDASYKAYSTWVRSAEAQEVNEGDEVFQTISISVSPRTPSNPVPDSNFPAVVDVDWQRSIPLPKIGIGMSSETRVLTEFEATLLKKMGISHLRCDLDLTTHDWMSSMQIATSQSQQLSVGLEIAVFVDSQAEIELKLFKLELDRARPNIASILVIDKGELATTPESIKIAQVILGEYPSHPLIGGGTDRNYFDLNFVHPSFDPNLAIFYSVNPQVHAFDVSSIVETLEGQWWTMKTAQRLYGKNSVAVTPITLKPRFNPDEIVPEANDPKELPPQVDPRQMSLFGASWTAGSVKSLAESGAASLTYYQSVGWRGLMETESGSKLPDKFLSRSNMVFPLYHVLCDICEMKGGNVHVSESNQPLSVNAVTITRQKDARTLIYNLTWETQEVSIRKIRSSKITIRRLNDETAEKAMFSPVLFRQDSGIIRDVDENGTIRLNLAPYEVVRIESPDYLD